MKFEHTGLSGALEEVCRRVETRLDHVTELRDLVVRVETRPDFSQDARMAPNGCMAHNPAAYDPVGDNILIHERDFPAKSPRIQEAILAHEIAHCLRLRMKAPLVMATLVEGLQLALDEEIVADEMASRWGYASELAEDRSAHYGSEYGREYGELLSAVGEPGFHDRALSWQQRYLADGRRPA